MSDTEAALAEMAFVISSMGDKTAMIIPTISSWFAVSWGTEYSVAYAASAIFCSAPLEAYQVLNSILWRQFIEAVLWQTKICYCIKLL